MCAVLRDLVLHLSGKLMYGILPSTTGFSSTGSLHRQDHFNNKRKTAPTRNNLKHSRRLINQTCISKNKRSCFPPARFGILILSSIVTEYSVFPLIRWCEEHRRGMTWAMECGSSRSKVPVWRNAEAALFAEEPGTDVYLRLSSQTS